MNELRIFENPEFGTIRAIEVDGEPWLVGKDVVTALGYTDTNHTIVDHVDVEDRVNSKTQGQNDPEFGQRGSWLINESGLYSLVLSSKLPTARKFRRWVTSEVLPSIRKTGGYISGQEEMSDLELLSRAVMVAQRQIEERNKVIAEQDEEIEAMRPAQLFANAVSASSDTVLVGELAKLLKQNGIEIGQNRLFDWLRTNGYLIRRKCSDYNMPTQRSMNLGLFEINEDVVPDDGGRTAISKTPKITGKGQKFFINKFLRAQDRQS